MISGPRRFPFFSHLEVRWEFIANVFCMVNDIYSARRMGAFFNLDFLKYFLGLQTNHPPWWIAAKHCNPRIAAARSHP
jgi:hypothetical protein